jgi:ATP-dependent Lon protease
VLYALDAITEPGVWKTLKRTMNHGKLELQPHDVLFPIGLAALKPEPVDLKVKIILIGDRDLYELLYTLEEDFRKIFKIRVEFDDEMEMADDVILEFGGRLRKLSDDEKLCPFDRSAVAALMEYGVRIAGRRNKVTARFVDLADLAREACYAARENGETPVSGVHVRKALDSKIERHNLIETKFREMIDEGTLLVDTDGKRVGQINGLTVLEIGGYAFGRPIRITATAALGRAGVINIEREANLSGRLHDKGVQIIEGYLRRIFAQDKPLSLAASLCFEQSYSGVDGDSASATEIFALLSAMSGLPIRQDVAVTGSVNQQGDVQPIGGVNQKIEGFFDICRVKGLTGEQGVIIPARNVEDLMLREDVVAAVAAGRFHIWPVDTIEQGIEILTGVRAGIRDAQEKFEKGSVLALADERLREMAGLMRNYSWPSDSSS